MNEIKLALAELLKTVGQVLIAQVAADEAEHDHEVYMQGFNDGFEYAYEDEDSEDVQ